METTSRMAVDESGLVHGGFIFGLADYSAMIAVNHPHVVLASAEVKFLRPVRVHDVIVAVAIVTRTEGRKHVVSVTVEHGEVKVFQGEFFCFVPDKHVLS
jgi:acyl-coenzyme A thioesterase PaaI-like protein